MIGFLWKNGANNNSIDSARGVVKTNLRQIFVTTLGGELHWGNFAGIGGFGVKI
jgi:hypothetical protein